MCACYIKRKGCLAEDNSPPAISSVGATRHIYIYIYICIYQCCPGTRMNRIKHPSLTPSSWFTS